MYFDGNQLEGKYLSFQFNSSNICLANTITAFYGIVLLKNFRNDLLLIIDLKALLALVIMLLPANDGG